MAVSRYGAAVALAAACLLGGNLPAAAGPALDSFGTSCGGHPEFFEFAVSGLDKDEESLARLCSCLATEFTPLSDSELVMLTHDVDGTATAEERTAFGDYTGLEIKARDALDKCLVAEGFSDTPDTPPAGVAADMTKFDAACTNSGLLLEIIGGEAEAANATRTTMCGCLSETLATQVTTDDANILAADLDGTATPASQAAYENYGVASETAGAAFEACFSKLPQAPATQ
jgi:hypothetical protein